MPVFGSEACYFLGLTRHVYMLGREGAHVKLGILPRPPLSRGTAAASCCRYLYRRGLHFAAVMPAGCPAPRLRTLPLPRVPARQIRGRDPTAWRDGTGTGTPFRTRRDSTDARLPPGTWKHSRRDPTVGGGARRHEDARELPNILGIGQ